MLDDHPDFAFENVPLQVANAGQIEFVNEFAVDATLDFFELSLAVAIGS
jgi:hypothetical protein